MQRSQINYINSALSLQRIRDVPYNYIKLNSSEILVDTIFGNFKLKELFNRICQHINKRIVYEIKMMNGKEVITLRLSNLEYGCYHEYICDVILLFTLLNNNTNIDTHSRIIETMSDYKTFIVSYEIDDTGRLNTDYLDICSLPTVAKEIKLYNLNDNTLTRVSVYTIVTSFELRNNLIARINSDYVSNIMNDILRIVPSLDEKNRQFIINDEIIKNRICIYMSVDFAVLNTFLIERFGRSLPNDNGIFTDLEFGIHLDYNLADGKICGFGFCDYF